MKHLVAVSLLFFTACPWDPQVLEENPPLPPGQAKYAYVFADNGDHWFNHEATELARALRGRGWTTYLTGETSGQTRPLVALEQIVMQAVRGDRVFIDFQSHGGDASATFNTSSGPQQLGFGWGAQWHALNPNAYYPTDPAIFATHGVGVWHAADDVFDWLTPENIAPSVRALRAKGVDVAIFDHSCNGGATVEYFIGDDVCAASTAGAMGPGLTGWPALSSAVPSLVDANQAAKWMTRVINDDNRSRGQRLHQSGFATGCDRTLPVREMLDPVAGGYGTWWHWMRNNAEHVAREPFRYTVAEEAAEPTQTAGWHPDVANAEGWRAWLFDGLAEIEQDPSFTAEEKTTLRAQIVALGYEVQTQASYVQALRNALLSTRIGYAGGSFTLDTFLREALTSQCICTQASGNDAWTNYTASTDCAGRTARTQSVMASLRPTASSCNDPRGYADDVMASFPVVQAAYASLLAQEARIKAAAIAVNDTLTPIEMRCHSSQCAAFRF